LLATETASSCGTRERNSQRRRARRDSRARTADTISVSTLGRRSQPVRRIWNTRQESDLRGLRSERSWDASNPHLNGRRASKELHPTSGLWRPVPRYEDRPDWRSAVSPSHMPRTARSAFQTAPGPCRVHAARWRKAVGLDPHIREDATRFRNEGARPRTSPSSVLAEAERVERSRPSRVIVGFKPTKHATCEPLGWRRADHSKAMPF
jgi:hypothetical protein